MATLNRGVAVAVQNVFVDAINRELEQIQPPSMADLGLVDTTTLAGVRARTADMVDLREYSMMKEWRGERDMQRNRRYFQVRMHNRKFYDSIKVDVEDIEDQNIANLNPEGKAALMRRGYEDRVNFEMADYFKHAFDDRYIGGTTTGADGEIVYVGSMDGEPLLSENHPYFEQIEFDEEAPPSQRVKLTQGGTFSNFYNEALTADNLWAAKQRFMEYKNFRGQPANAGVPDTLVVPPALEQEAREILERATIESDSGNAGVSNITRNQFQLRVDPWLSDTITADFTLDETDYTDQEVDLNQAWYLVNTQSVRKPFIFWNRTPPQLQRLVGQGEISFTNENPAEGEVSYSIFKDDAMVIGIRARMGLSFGLPQTIYGSLGGQSLS